MPIMSGTLPVLRSAFSANESIGDHQRVFCTLTGIFPQMRQFSKAFYHACLSVVMGAGVAATTQRAAATAVEFSLTRTETLPRPKEQPQ